MSGGIGSMTRVIRRLGSIRCTQAQARLLIAVPLSKNTFAAHLRTRIPWPWRRAREFSRIQAAELDGFGSMNRCELREAFHAQIALPAVTILSQLRQRCPETIILPDITFEAFRRELADDEAVLTVLVAHHAETQGGIEFADGIHRWQALLEALAKLALQRNNLTFCVCSTSDYVLPIYAELENIGSLAYAWWPMEFPASLSFIGEWFSQLDGKRYLEDAFDVALSEHLKDTLSPRRTDGVTMIRKR